MHSTFARSAVIVSALALSGPAHADLTWGVNGHPLVSYPGVTVEQQLDYTKDLGMRSYRVDVPGTDKIPKLHRLVREAKTRGIEILPVITPPFDLGAYPTDVLEKKAYDLAFTLVSGFKGDIRVWELANEIESYAIIKPCEMRDDGVQYNCSYGPAGGNSSLDYFGPRWAKVSAVLKGLTSGAHAADPAVQRAIGTAGWGHVGAFERMKKDGIPWEISVWHMYGGDPEWAFKELVKYRRPIWVTEFNNLGGSQKSEYEQAEGLAETIAYLRRYQVLYNVEAAHIYELLDETYWVPSYESYLGLVRLEKAGMKWKPGGPKIAYDKIKQLLSTLSPEPSGLQSLNSVSIAPSAPQTAPALPQKLEQDIAIHRDCELAPATSAHELEAEQVITYAYCLTLGRNPDGVGLKGWTAKLANQMSVSDLLVALMQSDEFAHAYGVHDLSPASYTTLIYRLLTDKDPDPATLQKLDENLKQGTIDRDDIQKSVIASEQFRSQHTTLARPMTLPPMPSASPKQHCTLSPLAPEQITSLSQIAYGYCLVLGRWPDGLGLNAWQKRRLDGLTVSQLLSELLQSAEFQNEYAINRMSNELFVTFMYRLLLQREPDVAGLQEYVSGLDNNSLSRDQTWNSIISSEEFHNKHAIYFRRPLVGG